MCAKSFKEEIETDLCGLKGRAWTDCVGEGHLMQRNQIKHSVSMMKIFGLVRNHMLKKLNFNVQKHMYFLNDVIKYN